MVGGWGAPVVGEGARVVSALMDQETSGLDKGNQGNLGRGINLIQYIIILITV